MSSDDIYGPFSDGMVARINTCFLFRIVTISISRILLDLLLNDDFVGIDLLADLDECEKNYLEGKSPKHFDSQTHLIKSVSNEDDVYFNVYVVKII